MTLIQYVVFQNNFKFIHTSDLSLFAIKTDNMCLKQISVVIVAANYKIEWSMKKYEFKSMVSEIEI